MALGVTAQNNGLFWPDVLLYMSPLASAAFTEVHTLTLTQTQVEVIYHTAPATLDPLMLQVINRRPCLRSSGHRWTDSVADHQQIAFKKDGVKREGSEQLNVVLFTT